jgi:hypothetical protein
LKARRWQAFKKNDFGVSSAEEFCNLIRNPIFDGAAEPRHQKLGSLFYGKALISIHENVATLL